MAQPDPRILTDPAAAEAACRSGQEVVLIVTPGTVPKVTGSGPGRLALFFGDPSDSAVRAGAEDMAAELFGRYDPGGRPPGE